MDFSLETLTAAINDLPHLPTQLGDSGLFEYAGVSTLTVDVEKKGHTLGLVSTAPRGASGEAMGRSQRELRNFRIPHLPMFDHIMADEVQGVREFGTTNQPEPLERRMQEVMSLGKGKLDYTLEAHRVGALKGIVLDKDGSTLYNFFTEFGVEQQVHSFELDQAGTDVRAECDLALDKISDELGGVMMTGAVAWCGKNFFNKLIAHPSVKDTYLNQVQAAELRGKVPDSVDIGGITFIRYRGKVGSTPLIGDDDSYTVPTGVPGLLIGRFAPAPYNETVNTIGLPIYAKALEKRNGTGWDLEMQSNPLHILTRPRAVIKGTLT